MTVFRKGEYHSFEGNGQQYVYLVPSAAVFKLDDASVAVLDTIGDREVEPADLAVALGNRFPMPEV